MILLTRKNLKGVGIWALGYDGKKPGFGKIINR
jgi:hypothetical protein